MALVILAMSVSVGQAQAPVLLFRWGDGCCPGQFQSPSGVTIDQDDNIYVTDYNWGVQVFNADGQFLRRWDVQGAGGIAVDANHRVYVVDQVGTHISIFTSGVYLGEPLPIARWGDVSVAATGLVYVVASGCNGISKWTALMEHYLGGMCIANPSASGGRSVHATSTGSVFVNVRNTIYRFSSSTTDSTFTLHGSWGGTGPGDGQFRWANGMATDASGRLFVCDGDGHSISVFSESGQFLFRWGSRSDVGFPLDIAFDSRGDIYVVDSNGYVAKFRFPPVAVQQKSWSQVRTLYR